jgi:diguanylate cyclase (GGDEF)-like protein/PAS domain S-box-containing protein
MSDIICLHRLDGSYSYVSPSCETILGYSYREFIDTPLVELIHPNDKAFLEAAIFPKLICGESVKPIQCRVRKATGEYIWIEVFVDTLKDDQSKLIGFVSSSRDITERKQMQEQMLEGALLYDSLTSLPNRTLFMDRLEQALRKQGREDELFAVLFLDLDRFKVVNDSLGHNVGDQLLLETSKRILSCIRSHDTLARLGGDEFALILDNVSEEMAEDLASRITQALNTPIMIEGYPVVTSASIGITMSNAITDSDQLLRSADLAMYHVKTRGKAGHAVFNEAMNLSAQNTLDLELELRSALQQNEFFLTYQPIVDLQSGVISGFEALIRWQNPKRGLISPAVFIPIAEEVGLIPAIDDWVLLQACQQLATWNKQLRLTTALSISVNLSTKNFAVANLTDRIEEVLTKTGLAASQLKLEITETVLMDNADVARHVLTKLRAKGITLQIDDFGTGYSSLSYLHKLPLQSLKVDRSFIKGLPGSQEERAIIASIVALGKSLNLEVVAEGIETPEQLVQVQALGCHFGQGYLFSKPIPANEIEERFLKNNQLLIKGMSTNYKSKELALEPLKA